MEVTGLSKPISAVEFHLIKREIRSCHQRVGGNAWVILGDANAEAGGLFTTVDHDGRLDRSKHASGDHVSTYWIGAHEQHGKLVAAKSRDEIDVPHASIQSCSNGLQQGIAGLMPEPVVDLFEMVNIDEHQREGRLFGATLRQHLDEVTTIRKSRQRVVMAGMSELTLDFPLGRDVGKGAHDRTKSARRGTRRCRR